MLSLFRDRFGAAGLVVAIIALVVALGGGALAATGGSGDGKAGSSDAKATASAKAKKGPRGPKGAAGAKGATGPTGPAGAQGPAGSNGKDGASGSNGVNGAAGPTGPTGPKGAAGFPGAEGPTGPTGTYGGSGLSSGVTETGYWSVYAPGTKEIEDGGNNMVTVGSPEAWANISFPDQVTSINPSEYVVSIPSEPNFSTTCGTGDGGAGGTAGKPKAPPGVLCVFIIGNTLENLTLESVCAVLTCPIEAMWRTGAFLKFNTISEGPGFGSGSWAITGI